jgi:hypothetical protein
MNNRSLMRKVKLALEAIVRELFGSTSGKPQTGFAEAAGLAIRSVPAIVPGAEDGFILVMLVTHNAQRGGIEEKIAPRRCWKP